MKKRQQAANRRRMNEEEPEPKPQFATKDEIFRELFGGAWKEEVVEPEIGLEEELEYLDSDPIPAKKPEPKPHLPTRDSPDYDQLAKELSSDIDEREKRFDEQTDRIGSDVVVPSIDTAIIPGKDDDISDRVTKTTAGIYANKRLVEMLHKRSSFQLGFMLKEVLDRPRSLRRNIR